MRGHWVGGLLLVLCLQPAEMGTAAVSGARTMPMRFELHREAPAETCGAHCWVWITATGMITADTARQFEVFVGDRSPPGATVVLDSDGGSVHGALALGRAIRRLGYSTMVGRKADRRGRTDDATPEWTGADCESMCAFVLLGGVQREVPADSRVLVHQIWLGDRRDDAAASTYSAEDLVLVQRDIGKVLNYVVEMGGDAELLELALRIPPWEPMRVLSRAELRRTRLDRIEEPADRPLNASASAASAADDRSATIIDSGWMTIEKSNRTMIARRHPLTFEGERIGRFDLIMACGDAGTFVVSYLETRGGSSQGVPAAIKSIRLWLDQVDITLKVVTSEVKGAPRRLETLASAAVPAKLVRSFADEASRSLAVETVSRGNPATMIRVGNKGFAQSFAGLEASCQQQQSRRDTRAELDTLRTVNNAGRTAPR
jgi:hypothetical protein